MPPFHPPWEILITEAVYFLIITCLCLIIYFMTKDIYNLSKHKGIYHFRNIFLYFSFAYLLRLINILLMSSREFFNIARPGTLYPLSMFLFSYFSTMAILSVITTLLMKNLKIKESRLNLVLHTIALISSFIVLVTRSHPILMLIQIVILFVSIIFVIKGKHKRLVSQNKLTFGLLFIFWILNLFILTERLFPWEYKIPLYVVSIAIFFSIYYRVHKRLTHVKKEG